jgi:hypothetical protein
MAERIAAMTSDASRSFTAFFDPWIDLDYYYTLLPLLPLIFDRVFVYYPSDRWVLTTSYLQPLARLRYQENLLYWLKEGVLVPVVKGDYPFTEHIGTSRLEKDGPSNEFRAGLTKIRRADEAGWVILDRDATERGRESAKEIINLLGGSDEVARAMRVQVDRAAVPELAYHYAGGEGASVAQTLLETVGTYQNDDWIRQERELGEYVLPSVKAYQYRALHDLLKHSESGDIVHQVALAALDKYAISRRIRTGTEWPEREQVKQWRDIGLHRILREFLASEAEVGGPTADDGSEAGLGLAERLASLRDHIPVRVAAGVLDQSLLWNSVTMFSGALGGFVTSGPVGGLVGFAGGVIVGQVGERAVRLGLRRVSWARLVDRVAIALGSKPATALKGFALGFGDVTVFGTGER